MSSTNSNVTGAVVFLYNFSLSTALILLLAISLPGQASGIRGMHDLVETNHATQGNTVFLPPVTYGTGADDPVALAVGDLNGDGFPDLVVANQCTSPDFCGAPGVLGVLLSNGDGTFQPAVPYSSGGSFAYTVAIADVNGDGKPDLVVVNGVESTVGILHGNGDGTFQPASTFASGGYDYFNSKIVVADVNGDGKLDLVVMHGCASACDDISPPQGSVSVFLQKPDGTFRPPLLYASGGYFTDSLAVGDLNGDDKPDLVVANWCDTHAVIGNCDTPGPVAVLLGNGDGTFQPAVIYGAGGMGTLAVTAADVNGDGKLDLLTANCGNQGCGSFWPPAPGGVVGVLLGNGDGTFQPAVSYSAGNYTAISSADMNGDGTPDIVVANWSCANQVACIQIMPGNGDGTFQAAVNYDSPNLPMAMGVAELNHDGKLDIVATHGFGNGSNLPPGTADVLINNGVLNRSTSVVVTGGINPAKPGQKVVYVATITAQSGEQVTGTVTFMDGGAPIWTSTVFQNKAVTGTFRYDQGGLGFHSITATYSGDTDNDPSTSPVFTEEVGYSATIEVSTSGSPSFFGQPVTISASVHSRGNSAPDGELISFYDFKTFMGAAAISGGVARFTTSSLSARRHTIHAVYPGDFQYQPISGGVRQIVNKYSTSSSLSSSPNPSAHNEIVTFTAAVVSSGPYAPTGKVHFMNGTTSLGSASLSGSVATFTSSKLAPGTHSITAEYQGDGASDKSTSPPVSQVVEP